MQAFQSITHNWLTAVASKKLDLPLQVIETDCSDAMALCVEDAAKNHQIHVFNIEFGPRFLGDPMEIFHQIARWYGDKHGDAAVEQIIEKNCYSAHVDILKSWYHRTYHFRKEPLLYDEAGYEEIEFNLSLVKLLNRFAQSQPFVVMVNHIDVAPLHFLSACNRLLELRRVFCQWGFLGFVSHSGKTHRLRHNETWQVCLRLLERQGLILPMEFQQSSATKQTYLWYKPPALKSFEEQYQMILSAADYFAYHDVIRMVSQVRKKYNDQHNGQLLFISAFCSLMKGDLEDAQRDFVKVQNRLQATENQAILTGSYFWLSICFTLKSQEKQAKAAQEQCEKLALDYSDKRWYALSLFAAFYIDAHITQHKLNQSSLESLQFMLSELGYHNIIALMLTQVFGHSDHFDVVSSRTYLRNCVKALRTARQSKNMKGASVALHAMGVVYMRIGNVKQTHRLYEQSLSILERYQRKGDLVPMLNALGYFLVGQEEWQKAWALFDRSLSLLIENRNFSEASITLYNYIWLFTQCGNIQRALDVLNDLLELMRIRNITNVPFRNLKDLYVLKGWLHILLQQPIQARYCLVRVNDLADLHETTFSRVLRHILSARVAVSEQEKAIAIRDNGNALKTLNASNDLDLYTDVTLRLEIAKIFVELGRKDDGQPIFARLRKKAHELNMNTMAQRISRASLGLSSLSEVVLPSIAQPYRVLMDLAQKETQMSLLQQQLSEIHQVNLMVDLSANEQNTEAFLKQIIGILDRRVPAEHFGILVSDLESVGQFDNLLLSNEAPKALTDGWQDWLTKQPAKEMAALIGEDHCAAWPLKMGVSKDSWLVVAGDFEQQRVWNGDFLRLVAQQLGLILDRRFREAYLEHRNKTDLLTGVLNRAGLFERLKKQFKHMKRRPLEPFSLCYFDLDHFKYFNDTFGHELGDHVLKNLVQIVESHLRSGDELGRVGGDEFILLLRDTNKDAAALVIERLRMTLAEPDWWLPLLKNSTHQGSNPVPKKEWISASFGVIVIEGWTDAGISRIDLIAQGDAAMYEAKKAGKNCIVVKQFQSNLKQK